MTVEVNGIAIGRQAVAQEARFHADAPVPEEAARYALAIRELLLGRARELGLPGPANGDEDALLDAVLEREVSVPEATGAECRRYYERNAERFRSGDLVEASHILFAVTPSGPVGALRATAEKTLEALKAEPDRFGEFAAKYSNCPSGAQGGNLGQLTRGETVPEFETALFEGAATGILPRLVNTRYGFHIVKVARRIEGRQVPFEMVQGRIAEYLTSRTRRTAMRQYLKILAGRARISGIDFEAATTPLVR